MNDLEESTCCSNPTNAPDGVPTLTDECFRALLSALSSCEDNGSTTPLSSWIDRHHSGDVNTDVVLGTNDNRGSPLLIACELDMPAAVAVLLRRGADPNYRHPKGHGSMPLLRCAEMGHDQCLQALLGHPEIDVVEECATRDYKLVLGQNVPLYEAGGRSALMLAVEAGQERCVELLLAQGDDCDGTTSLLHRSDSFGRSPIEASFEKLSLRRGKRHGAAVVESQRRICRLLCTAAGMDYAVAESEMSISANGVCDRERKRNVELRARFVKKAHATQQEEMQRGLEIVEASYCHLRLHPKVYADAFPKEAMLLDVDTLGMPEAMIHELLPGTFSLPLMKREHCKLIYEELLHYEKKANEQPYLGLPLHTRHDGNLGSLQNCGFQPLLHAIESVLQPIVQHCLMPNKNGNELEVYHAFLTRNHVHRDENANFKVHCDKSDITLNICLEASDDLVGSTVGFYNNNPSDLGQVPTEEDRVYTHQHRVGHAVLHTGRQWHKTDPIVCGTRSSLIVWARRC